MAFRDQYTYPKVGENKALTKHPKKQWYICYISNKQKNTSTNWNSKQRNEIIRSSQTDNVITEHKINLNYEFKSGNVAILDKEPILGKRHIWLII